MGKLNWKKPQYKSQNKINEKWSYSGWYLHSDIPYYIEL